jgi:histidine triad (HIT) family protein
VFCKIVAKQIPATVVYEDRETLAFMDIGQVNPGHVLVAAKAHAENIYALDDDGRPVCAAARLPGSHGRCAAFAPPGLSIYQANGSRRDGRCFHFHVHLVPRHPTAA